MGKKMTSQVAIVNAKADSMPVLAGVDTRVMEDMITVVIHEEIAQIDNRIKALQESLLVLKKGGKPDVRMANIVLGYYEYTCIPRNHKVAISINKVAIGIKNTGNEYLHVYSLSLGNEEGKIGSICTDNVICQAEAFINKSHYLPRIVTSSAWRHYLDTISKNDREFIEKYMNEMAGTRAEQLASCEEEINKCHATRSALCEKKNNVGVIAARIRIENSSVNEKDMAIVKKFLGI